MEMNILRGILSETQKKPEKLTGNASPVYSLTKIVGNKRIRHEIDDSWALRRDRHA